MEPLNDSRWLEPPDEPADDDRAARDRRLWDEADEKYKEQQDAAETDA